MSFTSNIHITKTFPGVLYDATETSGTWHEDHEISGAKYQAANAKFNEAMGQWFSVDTTKPAYASVQNTDGSTSYLYMPPTTSGWATWQGAGQPVSYYAVNYGMTQSDTTGAINTPALAAAIAAAIADPGNTGAIVHIPAGTYKLNGTITISDPTGKSGLGLVITGASGGTTLSQKANVDIFDISPWTGGTGVRIKDLYLQYGVGAGVSGNTAVNVNTSGGNSAENITCERVYFDNCPMAFSAGPNSLQCGLLDCTIDYHNSSLNGQTAVSLGGSENFVRGCVIRQSKGNSPSGCIGVYVTGAMTCYVSDTHISHFQTGVRIVGGPTVETYFTNVHIDAWTTAVQIAPTANTGQIYEIHFSNCTFSLSNDSTTLASSGVTIGTDGGPNSNVAGIFFDNCSVFGFLNAGLEIDAGQNIVVTGGQYSSNGQNPSSTPYIGAGIAIRGGTEITIAGVDCSGISYYWQNVLKEGMTFVTQPYGITVNDLTSEVIIAGCNVTANATNGIVVSSEAQLFPSNILIRGCDASGYSSYGTAINIKPGETKVEVTDCAGYNDRGSQAVLQSTIPPPTNPISNVSFGYYGPIAFYVTGSGHVTIDGVDSNLTDGGYTLSPGETASSAGTATHFLAVGK